MSVCARCTAVAVCRLSSALPRERAAPATALAPESHILKNGFFRAQGFLIVPPKEKYAALQIDSSRVGGRLLPAADPKRPKQR